MDTLITDGIWGLYISNSSKYHAQTGISGNCILRTYTWLSGHYKYQILYRTNGNSDHAGETAIAMRMRVDDGSFIDWIRVQPYEWVSSQFDSVIPTAGYGSISALYLYATNSGVSVTQAQLSALLNSYSAYTGAGVEWKIALDAIKGAVAKGYANIAKDNKYKEYELFFVPKGGKFTTGFDNVTWNGVYNYSSTTLSSKNILHVTNNTPKDTYDPAFRWTDFGWNRTISDNQKTTTTPTNDLVNNGVLIEHKLPASLLAGAYPFEVHYAFSNEKYHVQVGVVIVY